MLFPVIQLPKIRYESSNDPEKRSYRWRPTVVIDVYDNW